MDEDRYPGTTYRTLVVASWECVAVVCPVVVFDGMDSECPGCGAKGILPDDWDEAQSQAEHDQIMDDYGTGLCLDEIQGRADLLIRNFDEYPKSKIIEHLTAIYEAAERIRPRREVRS